MKTFKIKAFKVDRNLGYLIQKVTNDPTQEILTYFHGIVHFVMEDVMQKSKARLLTKNIILFYKETPIPYRIVIHGFGPGYTYANEVAVTVEVSFPKTTEHHDVTNLMNAAVETGLQLSDAENMPVFEKPDLKTPGCLRKVRLQQDRERT